MHRIVFRGRNADAFFAMARALSFGWRLLSALENAFFKIVILNKKSITHLNDFVGFSNIFLRALYFIKKNKILEKKFEKLLTILD
jgi:hypothetical protein